MWETIQADIVSRYGIGRGGGVTLGKDMDALLLYYFYIMMAEGAWKLVVEVPSAPDPQVGRLSQAEVHGLMGCPDFRGTTNAVAVYSHHFCPHVCQGALWF